MMNWGILSPDDLGGLRRQQDLDLGAAVRHFNDRSVPGLGGLWFPMPIVWSVLAVSLAQKTGHGALHLANAIEAKAMYHNRRGGLNRIRGSRKLAKVDNGKFSILFPSGVYVAQPFRMGTGQPMRELGFVNGTRYNSFRLAPAGERMMGLLTECETKLLEWITQGKHAQGKIKEISPLAPLPHAVSKLILSRLVDGDGPDDAAAARRRNLIRFIGDNEGLSSSLLEEHTQPPKGITAAHWADLRAGAALIDLRVKALSVLSGVEGALKARRDANAKRQCLTVEEAVSAVTGQLDEIRKQASLVAERIETAEEKSSIKFVQQCRDLAPKQLLRKLALRDNSVICLRDDQIVPGPAAADLRPDTNEEKDEQDSAEENRQTKEYAPQLYRLEHLYSLYEELSDEKNPMSPGFPKGSAS